MCLLFKKELDEPIRTQETFIISLFSIVEIWVESKFFFLVDILSFGSGSVDLHIFADLDPGSKNLPDLTDPDPKHCKFINI